MNKEISGKIKALEKQVKQYKETSGRFQSQYVKQMARNDRLQAQNKALQEEMDALRANIQPMRDNINSLTAERSRFIRKLRRAGVKV